MPGLPTWPHNFTAEGGCTRCGAVSFLDLTGLCPIPPPQAAIPGGPHRIRCISDICTPPGAPDPHTGKWLTAYDPQACDGNGYSAWARDPDQAIVFGTLRAAWDAWQAIDAFTVEFVAATP